MESPIPEKLFRPPPLSVIVVNKHEGIILSQLRSFVAG